MLSGDDVRAARKAAGLTQQELADRAGASLRTLQNWEGSASLPTSAVAKLRPVFESLPTGLGTQREPTLSQASTLELLAELTKRAARETGGALRDAAQLAVDPPGFAARAAREEAERREGRE